MSLEVQIARIDENVKHIKESLPEMSSKIDTHGADIADMKRDRKWVIVLITIMLGGLGTLATVLAEMSHS